MLSIKVDVNVASLSKYLIIPYSPRLLLKIWDEKMWVTKVRWLFQALWGSTRLLMTSQFVRRRTTCSQTTEDGERIPQKVKMGRRAGSGGGDTIVMALASGQAALKIPSSCENQDLLSEPTSLCLGLYSCQRLYPLTNKSIFRQMTF